MWWGRGELSQEVRGRGVKERGRKKESGMLVMVMAISCLTRPPPLRYYPGGNEGAGEQPGNYEGYDEPKATGYNESEHDGRSRGCGEDGSE